MPKRHFLLASPTMLETALETQQSLIAMGDERFEVAEIECATFTDRERWVRVPKGLQLSTAVPILESCTDPNADLWQQLFTIDALEGAGVSHTILCTPKLVYDRADRVANPGEALSMAVVAGCFKQFRTLRSIVCVEPHALQIAGFYRPITLVPVKSSDIMARYFTELLGGDLNQVAVVSPDAGALKRARKFRNRLKLRTAVGSLDKDRIDATTVVILGYSGDPKDIMGKIVILYDDMIASGSTAIEAAQYLMELGARQVYIVATHGIFTPSQRKDEERLYTAEERFEAAGFPVVFTRTVPKKEGWYAANRWATALPIGQLLAKNIHNMTTPGGSNRENFAAH